MERIVSGLLALVLALTGIGAAATDPLGPAVGPVAEEALDPAPPPHLEELSSESLSKLRAAVLRAEDRRVVDDALRAALAHPDARIRAAAIKALGRIGDPTELALLTRALGESSSALRAEAAFALGLIGEVATLPALIGAATDADAGVRERVGTALGLFGHDSASEALLRLLGDASPEVVVAAARAIPRFERGDFATPRLIEIAGGEAQEPRLAAVAALSRLSAAIGRIGVEARAAARARLVSVSDDPNPEIRRLAVEGLERMSTPEESKAVTRAFADKHPEVRIAAIGSLCHPGAPVGVHLREGLAVRDTRINLATVEGLGRMRGSKGAEQLQKLVFHAPWTGTLRLEALRALDRYYPTAAPAIARGVRDRDAPDLLAGAAEILARDDDPASLEAAERLIKTAEPALVVAALPALGRAEGTLAELLGAAPNSPYPELRAAAARAAGVRLGRESSSAEAREEARLLLLQLWKTVPPGEGPRVHEAILDAAIQARETGASVLRLALTCPFRHVRERAIRHLAAEFGEDHRAATGAASDLPAERYLEILRWADVPRAAIVTVRRPGFQAARFTLRLDTASAPLTAWRFSRLAEAGIYGAMGVERLVPNVSVGLGDPPAGVGNPVPVFRDEPRPGAIPAGALLLNPTERDSGRGGWSIALTERPELEGKATVFGQVVQNFHGVVGLLLPGDRVESIEIYEGDGSEPLPDRP